MASTINDPKVVPFPGVKPKYEGISISGGGGSGGNGGGNMTLEMKDYVDAKADSIRSDLQAAITRMEVRLEGVPGRLYVATVGASVFLGLLAVLAFGGDRFDGGVQLTSVSVEQALEARRIAEENANQMQELNKKMDTLLEVLRERVAE